ncbi:MAG: Gfo/Idh/MocA family protein [Haloarculaceae archaeon]
MFDVAIIGTGPDPENPDREGYAMAYQHAEGYQAHDDAAMVACADIVEENARAFADHHDLPDGGVYTDHEEMLEAVDPDIVSVCTPPNVHADLVIDCLESGVEAVHCEKPMAHTWGESRRMAAAAADSDTQLTFNHQRRFGKPFRRAKELLEGGAIGDLQRVELAAPNLMDYASHSVDLANYLVGSDPEWVIGQAEYRGALEYFGVHNEQQGLFQWQYEDGTQALAATGEDVGPDLVGAHHRLVGSEGAIELGSGFMAAEPPEHDHRIRRDGGDWEPIETDGESVHGPGFVVRAIADVIESVRDDRPCELRAENALEATKVIFGGYESARRRGRVEFPLEIDDHPLEALIAAADAE